MHRAPALGVPFAQEVIEAMRLAPLFAQGALNRCCQRAGLDPRQFGPKDLEPLLPHLENMLRIYKTGPEVLAALDRLRRLATRSRTQVTQEQRSAG